MLRVGRSKLMRGDSRVCAAVPPGEPADARYPSPGSHHPGRAAEIAQSSERSRVLAKRYGVSTETIRKWRQRGPDACQDRSARPYKLPRRASDEECAAAARA